METAILIYMGHVQTDGIRRSTYALLRHVGVGRKDGGEES